MKKTLGMVGGMGPLASAYCYERIVFFTDAKKDQDHIPIIIDSRSSIPDRSAFLLGKGKDPYPSLLDSCKKLETLGVDAIILACNTAHFWADSLQQRLSIPIIHMIREVTLEIKENPSFQKGLGLLGTEGLKLFANYQEFLNQEQIPCLITDQLLQEEVNNIIYKIKAQGITQFIIDSCNLLIARLKEKGWEHIILGCTELASLEPFLKKDTHYINSIDVLAKRTIKKLGYPLKGEKDE